MPVTTVTPIYIGIVEFPER